MKRNKMPHPPILSLSVKIKSYAKASKISTIPGSEASEEM